MTVISTEVRVPVTVSRHGTAEVACVLTRPGTGPGSGRLIVAIPGGTYDGSSFTCPVPGYSFAARAAEAGMAFLAVDRVGTGRSDPVPAGMVTLAADAEAAAAAVRFARREFAQVVLLGQGLGGVVASCAAARLAAGTGVRTDLLVLLGAAHTRAAAKVLDPTQLKPVPAGQLRPGAGEGWVVARDPGRRHQMLHGPGADPDVLAWDTGTILSSRQFVELHGWLTAAPGQGPCAQVTAPVLLVAGGEDRLLASVVAGFGGTGLAVMERRYYPRAAGFAAHVVPRAGHCLTLDRHADRAFEVIADGISALGAPAAPAGFPG
jgi:pimeloyl-ACP methyl ester carboxylesterase